MAHSIWLIYYILYPMYSNLIFSSEETDYKWQQLNGKSNEYFNWSADQPQKSSLVTFNNKNFVERSVMTFDDFYYLKGQRYVHSDVIIGYRTSKS